MKRGCRPSVAGALIFTLFATSCGGWLQDDANGPADANAIEDPALWPEVFDFTMELAPMDVEQQETAIRDAAGPHMDLVGSSVYLGSIEAPQGRTDFFRAKVFDSDVGGQSDCIFGQATSGSSSTCGDLFASRDVISSSGGSGGGWSDRLLVVGATVARLEAVAADGTDYTIVPVGRVAFVQWKTERGILTVTAFDDDGAVLATETFL